MNRLTIVPADTRHSAEQRGANLDAVISYCDTLTDEEMASLAQLASVLLQQLR